MNQGKQQWCQMIEITKLQKHLENEKYDILY
jgi:hypothetical protein